MGVIGIQSHRHQALTADEHLRAWVTVTAPLAIASSTAALWRTVQRVTPPEGGLYGDTGQPGEAENTYTEALAIYRDLVARDPGAYLRA